jgi:hypothetical protein
MRSTSETTDEQHEERSFIQGPDIDSAMQASIVRVLLITFATSWLAGCTPPTTAAVPSQSSAERNDDEILDEQRALELRRLRLQNQLLSELRKLRESRQASTGGAEQANAEGAEVADEDKLLVFGGPSHEVFLGCLCDEQDRDSIFNMTGEYGSDLSETSIRNKFAPYGSDNDDTSTCNAVATRPPLVVTSAGKSLGLLTMNPALKKRITAPSVADWLMRMCAQ